MKTHRKKGWYWAAAMTNKIWSNGCLGQAKVFCSGDVLSRPRLKSNIGAQILVTLNPKVMNIP